MQCVVSHSGFENLTLHPAAKALHYAQEAFEGMKAYRGVDGRVRLFRPLRNMSRLRESARRCCLPSSFDEGELLKCITRYEGDSLVCRMGTKGFQLLY